MGQIWFKNNKAAEKFSEEDIVNILSDTLLWVESDLNIKLKSEVELYLMKHHSVGHDTHRAWLKIHDNNKSIQSIWTAIDLTLEGRMVYNEGKDIRPNIQALVLQNKHNYKEKRESSDNVTVKMGDIIKDGEVKEYKLGG